MEPRPNDDRQTTKRTKRSSIIAGIERHLRKDPALRKRVADNLKSLRLRQRLIALRKARGLSQAQLAKILGLTEAQLVELESDRLHKLKVLTFVRLVAALGGRLDVDVVADPSPSGLLARDR